MKSGEDMFAASPEAGRRNRKLGWFAAGAVLILVAALAAMAVQKGLFQRTTRLHFFADSARGMAPGMAVKLNGFRIGALDRLSMDADGRVNVTIRVGDEYVHLIHKDGRAHWAKEDLIGEAVIEIVPGSQEAPAVENDALLAFDRARDATEELGRLAGQFQPILADIKGITGYIDSPTGELKETVRQLQRAGAALADVGEDVRDITHHNKQPIQSAIASASNVMGNLDAALPPILKQADAGVQHAAGAASDVHEITGRMKTEIPAAVGEGRAALREGRTALGEGRGALEVVHETLDAAKQSWPLRNLLPPQEEHSLPLDSHVPPAR